MSEPPVYFPCTDENWDISYEVFNKVVIGVLKEHRILVGHPAEHTISGDIANEIRNGIEYELFGWK